MQHSFEFTKQAFEKVQTLSVPSPNGDYVLQCDASQTGIGACLFQVPDGLEKPIGYFSHSLKEAQKNYDSYKLELFASYQAVKYFAVFLSFLPHLIVRTDNQALRFWRMSEFAAGDVRSKWKSYLDPFRFDIVHQPGTLKSTADATSRAPQHVQCKNSWPYHWIFSDSRAETF
jgi:hypothetical protein